MKSIRTITITLAMLAGITAALCQVPPYNLPPSTVVGRSAASTGPAQAIPFSQLIAALLTPPLTIASINTDALNATSVNASSVDTTSINAGSVNTNSIAYAGASTGAVIVSAQAAAGTPDIKWPTTSGTVPTSATPPLVLDPVTGNVTCPSCITSLPGAPPYFSASLSANSGSLTSGTFTKIQFNTELADSSGWYDNATNFRFTPLVAGKYRINGCVQGSGTTVTEIDIEIRKNGSTYSRVLNLASGTATATCINHIVAFNGATDFVELFGSVTGTGTLVFLGGTAPIRSWFEAEYKGP